MSARLPWPVALTVAALVSSSAQAQPAPRTFPECQEKTLIPTASSYDFSYYERALGPCQPLEQELDARLDTYVALEENVLVFAGHRPSKDPKKAGEPAIFQVRLEPDGRIAETRILGRLPAPTPPSELKFMALMRFKGSKRLFIRTKVSTPISSAQSKVDDQYWTIDLAKTAAPRKIESRERATSFYPTAAGNLLLVQVSLGKDPDAPPTSRLVLVSTTTGKSKTIATLKDEYGAAVVTGAPLLMVRTVKEHGLFDLAKERLVALDNVPPGAFDVHAFDDRSLYFVAEAGSSGDSPASGSRCKPLALYRLPFPWTSPPVAVAGGFGSYNAVFFDHRAGRIEIAKNIRSPWLKVLRKLKLDKDQAPEPEDAEGGEEGPQMCADDLAKFPFDRQADLASYLVSTGKLEEHGCKQAPLRESPGAREVGPGTWPMSYTEPCASFAPIEKRLASIKVPKLADCAPLERRIEHCLTSIQAGDLPAFAACQGTDRPIPDLGSSTSLYFSWLAPLRIWSLRELAMNPALKPQVEATADFAVVRFTSRAGTSVLEMAFTKKADEYDEYGEEYEEGKAGCEWRLEGAEIVPAAAGAGNDGGR